MKKIPLTQGLFATVDDEDYEMLSLSKWYATKNGNTFYANRKTNNFPRKTIAMHRILINVIGDGLQVDHINGNGLDNRKRNLRVVTTRQNQQNQHVLGWSKYPGVTYKNKKWISQIKINGKLKNLGYFKTELEAYNKYLFACYELEMGYPT